ncbi:hypothetical protein CHS0354_018672 [Potamilus streckersoni]|uniref:Uncharacterized protein n=1 Tax=Potamilus streckersoni TaxID=2493646 RepID=A0AAE0VYG0_9BIVA|nr:hypothetical protein CHS0354_018672 [Potamilus streckersoni]
MSSLMATSALHEVEVDTLLDASQYVRGHLPSQGLVRCYFLLVRHVIKIRPHNTYGYDLDIPMTSALYACRGFDLDIPVTLICSIWMQTV